MTSVKCMEDIFTGCRSPFRDSNGYVVTNQTTFRKCKVVSGFFSPKTKNILLLCDVKYEATHIDKQKNILDICITTALLANAFTLLNNIFTFIDIKKIYIIQ